MKDKTKSHNLKDTILRIHPIPRVLISLMFAAAGLLLLKGSGQSNLVVSLFTWCIFALTYLGMCWIILFSRSIDDIKRIARINDGSRLFVAFIVLVSSFASMITVMFLIIDKNPDKQQIVTVPVSILGIVLSWVMVHTTLTFHYAHEYYDDDPEGIRSAKEGLLFPGDKQPDYTDFAYFSFVIGMTFQVSDVQITSRKLRKLALLHGLLAFGLNTFVVALTINLIAGLSN